RGFVFGSPPPVRAAMVNSRISLVNARPRFASVAAFLCLIVAHFECPDMHQTFIRKVSRLSVLVALRAQVNLQEHHLRSCRASVARIWWERGASAPRKRMSLTHGLTRGHTKSLSPRLTPQGPYAQHKQGAAT